MNKKLKKQVKECLEVNEVLDEARELASVMFANGLILARKAEGKIPNIDDPKKRVNDAGKEYVEHNYTRDTNSEQHKAYLRGVEERDSIKKYGEDMISHIESVMWAELHKLTRIIDDILTD